MGWGGRQRAREQLRKVGEKATSAQELVANTAETLKKTVGMSGTALPANWTREHPVVRRKRWVRRKIQQIITKLRKGVQVTYNDAPGDQPGRRYGSSMEKSPRGSGMSDTRRNRKADSGDTTLVFGELGASTRLPASVHHTEHSSTRISMVAATAYRGNGKPHKCRKSM